MTTQTPENKPRALIAMSGGVDSSVAAWLMQQAGYDCTGITMRLTRNETLGQSGFHTCCSEKDIEDAAEVAFALDIPYEVLDFTADFREQIIEKFIRVYEAGGTPNPCIDCNKYMKFRHLLDWAEAHGMEYVVTGHYARVEQDEATGRFLLKKGLDEGKDQSYVLYNLTQEQLAHIRLPLGGLHKTEVREIAEQHKFVNARKHDSQDICFVPDGDYARFMEDFTGKHYPAGNFLDENGKVVGTHNGAVRYTIGQRKGLGLALGAPVYVCGKDMQANTVTVGPEADLFDCIVYADEANWIAIPELTEPLRVTARTLFTRRKTVSGWNLTSPSAPPRLDRLWCCIRAMWCWAAAPLREWKSNKETKRNARSVFPHPAAAGRRGNGKAAQFPRGRVRHRRRGGLHRGGPGSQRRGGFGPHRRR